MFLSFENESVAAAYRDLYWELVKHIAGCLACDESIYFGGVRRLSMKDLSEEFRETLLHQNARSWARRCLHLSREGLETLPGGLEPWMQVLRRARQRVRVDEARDRRRVKAILMSALQTVVGLDPAKNRSALTRRHFEEAVGNQWPKLKYILERDLDIEIPELQKPILDNSLEAFVSHIQKLLDGSTDRASVTAVASIDAISPSSQFDDLCRQYNDAFPDRKLTRDKDTKILVATNLGETIGFIGLRQNSRYGAASLEIEGFLVAEHMRRQGVGSRLVRKAVEYADQKELKKGSRVDKELKKGSRVNSVWIHSLVPKEAKELFLRCGFRPDEERLTYQIDRLHEVDKLAARSSF